MPPTRHRRRDAGTAATLLGRDPAGDGHRDAPRVARQPIVGTFPGRTNVHVPFNRTESSPKREHPKALRDQGPDRATRSNELALSESGHKSFSESVAVDPPTRCWLDYARSAEARVREQNVVGQRAIGASRWPVYRTGCWILGTLAVASTHLHTYPPDNLWPRQAPRRAGVPKRAERTGSFRLR